MTLSAWLTLASAWLAQRWSIARWTPASVGTGLLDGKSASGPSRRRVSSSILALESKPVTLAIDRADAAGVEDPPRPIRQGIKRG